MTTLLGMMASFKKIPLRNWVFVCVQVLSETVKPGYFWSTFRLPAITKAVDASALDRMTSKCLKRSVCYESRHVIRLERRFMGKKVLIHKKMLVKCIARDPHAWRPVERILRIWKTVQNILKPLLAGTSIKRPPVIKCQYFVIIVVSFNCKWACIKQCVCQISYLVKRSECSIKWYLSRAVS